MTKMTQEIWRIIVKNIAYKSSLMQYCHTISQFNLFHLTEGMVNITQPSHTTILSMLLGYTG